MPSLPSTLPSSSSAAWRPCPIQLGRRSEFLPIFCDFRTRTWVSLVRCLASRCSQWKRENVRESGRKREREWTCGKGWRIPHGLSCLTWDDIWGRNYVGQKTEGILGQGIGRNVVQLFSSCIFIIFGYWVCMLYMYRFVRVFIYQRAYMYTYMHTPTHTYRYAWI